MMKTCSTISNLNLQNFETFLIFGNKEPYQLKKNYNNQHPSPVSLNTHIMYYRNPSRSLKRNKQYYSELYMGRKNNQTCPTFFNKEH